VAIDPDNVSGTRSRRKPGTRGGLLVPADTRDRDDLPDAAKPGVQREQERGGASVRAVMGMVGQAALANEGGDLLGREAVASNSAWRLAAARVQ